MNKKREHPDRKALLQFGRTVCGVARPEATIERIATTMEETLRDEGQRIDSSFLARLRKRWGKDCSSMQPPTGFHGTVTRARRSCIDQRHACTRPAARLV